MALSEKLTIVAIRIVMENGWKSLKKPSGFYILSRNPHRDGEWLEDNSMYARSRRWRCRNPHRDGEWLEDDKILPGVKTEVKVAIRIVMENGWKS